jgi:hypothetical protein
MQALRIGSGTHTLEPSFQGSGSTRHLWKSIDNTGQQDFVPRKVYCVYNVTFHAESKYAIKSFPSPTVFVQWHFYY